VSAYFVSGSKAGKWEVGLGGIGSWQSFGVFPGLGFGKEVLKSLLIKLVILFL
jgi:hypothetical protein